MLASTGEPFLPAVIEGVTELAGENRPGVVVLSVARIWGTALGLPHPGLYPTRGELDAQRDLVEKAARQLEERGFPVRTSVVRARNAGKAIARSAERAGCETIVIADPERRRWDLLLRGDPPREIARRTGIRVHAVRVREAPPS